MKRTLIYLTITVVVITLITTVLMFSASGSSAVKLYWAVSCAENSCNLKVSSLNFIGEDEETGNITNTEGFVEAGSLSTEAAAAIDSVKEVPWYQYRSLITSVTLGGEDDEVVPKNMYGWFYGMEKLEDIDFSHVDSYYSIDFTKMFYGCVSLRNLDLSPLRIPYNNSSSSTDIFAYTYLDSITFSSDTYLLLDYGFWAEEGHPENEFYYDDDNFSTAVNKTYINTTPKFYYKINNGTLSITSNPEVLNGEPETFEYADNKWITNYEGSKNTWFDKYTEELKTSITKVVIDGFYPMTMYRLFANLTDLTSVNIIDIDTSSTIDMNLLFSNCKKLMSLDLSMFDTQSTNADPSVRSSLFENCVSLREVTISDTFGFAFSEGTWTDSNGTTYDNGLITPNVNETYRRYIIYWGVSGKTLTISNDYVNGQKNGVYYYTTYVDSEQNELTPAPWTTSTYSSLRDDVEHIVIGSANSKIKPISMRDWFKGFKKVESIDLSNIDTSETISINSAFANMTKLKSVDLSKLSFPKLESAVETFAGSTSLESVNLTGFNPPQLVDISLMFRGSSSLEEVDLSSLTGTNIMTYGLFNNCSSLRVVNMSNMVFSGLDAEEIEENYSDVFKNCNKLSQITIGPSNAAYIKTQLPTPIESNIPGADGKWHTYSTEGGNTVHNSYTVEQIPEDVTQTYYATSPKTLSFYDYETNTLLRSVTYVYGTKYKLPNDFTKQPTNSIVTTSFVSSDGQTFDDINSTITTTYKISGYKTERTEEANTLEVGYTYTIENDASLYVTFENDSISYETIALPSPTRFGYTFEGWAANPTETDGMFGGYPAQENTTLYATWKEIVHNFIDDTASVNFKLGITKKIVLRIDGDLHKFVDLYIGENKLTRDTHYVASSGSTIITFTDEGINYINKLPAGSYEIRALFDDTNAVGVSALTISEPGKHTLVIHYRYSGSRSNEKVFDDYFNDSIKEGETYNVTSKSKENYTFDKEVVSGTMGDNDIEVTVTYTPKNDKNHNDKADEEEQTSTNETNTNSNTSNNTNKDTNKDVIPSPKTRDNIILYVVLELVSLLVGVIIFIRIKAH